MDSYNASGNVIVNTSRGTNQQGSSFDGSSDDISEDSDEEPSSSNFNLDNKIIKLEKEFKKLLDICSEYESSCNGKSKVPNKLDIINDKAKCLYLKGMVCEKDSNITDALQYYRKATKLIPEIDIHISKALDYGSKNKSVSKKTKIDKIEHMPKDLLQKFRDTKTKDLENDDILKAIHHNTTNCLLLIKIPKEILLYIFRWAVSNELDIKCLEALGKVCRTFYLCSRDKEIWYLACKKVWGKDRIKDFEQNNSSVVDNSIKPINWRSLYINQPHPRFEGSYVSKATYWRYGEANPENSYLPCYAIKHFRYLKFYADGQRVCALTSPEAPHIVLPKMSQPKFSSELNEILHGRYQLIAKQTIPGTGLTNMELSVVLVKKTLVERHYPNRKVYNRANHKNQGETPSNLTTYYMKFTIHPNSRGRPNCKLIWKHYSIFIKYSNGNKSKTVFDLSQDKYPPFSFNPVSWKWSGDIKAPLN